MSDDFPPTGSAPTPIPPLDASTSAPRRSRSGSSSIGTWLIAAVVVLVLAVAGGLFTAWVVANMRAVPGPIAGASPTPRGSSAVAGPTASAGESVEPTDAPRRTPTAVPTVEVTSAPFVYVIQPGDHLVNIADMFQVDVQDIIDLNGITNPNRISVGQELLIPGYGVQPTPKPTKAPK